MNGTWEMKIYGPRDVMLYDVLACHTSSAIFRGSIYNACVGTVFIHVPGSSGRDLLDSRLRMLM